MIIEASNKNKYCLVTEGQSEQTANVETEKDGYYLSLKASIFFCPFCERRE